METQVRTQSGAGRIVEAPEHAGYYSPARVVAGPDEHPNQKIGMRVRSFITLDGVPHYVDAVVTTDQRELAAMVCKAANSKGQKSVSGPFMVEVV